MSSSATHVAIVGASVGGVRTARSLRAQGFEGDITVVGAEAKIPYDKPPLSKAGLLGKSPEAGVPLITKEEAFENRIVLKLGHAATRLDLARSAIELEGGQTLAFDELVIATGPSARPSPWGTTDGIHLLRSLDDSARLRSDLVPGEHLVVVGAGFIGSEVASSARSLGLKVSIVDPLPIPMSRVVGDRLGAILSDSHALHGTATHFGVGVESIDGSRGSFSVTLTDGQVMNADVVVVGIGVELNIGWLESSGLALDDGVVCDSYSRAVNHEHVYAVGDISRWLHPRHGRLTRVEHWTNAVEQGACVAHNIVNPDRLQTYSPVEYVWSDQYDRKIQFTGVAIPTDTPILLGDPDVDRRFGALWHNELGLLTGALSVNWPRVTALSREVIAAGQSADSFAAKLRPAARPDQPAASPKARGHAPKVPCGTDGQ